MSQFMTDVLFAIATPLKQLRAAVVALWSDVVTTGDALGGDWQPRVQRPTFRASARNLGFCLALRRSDLRPLQHHLAAYGLSSLDALVGGDIFGAEVWIYDGEIGAFVAQHANMLGYSFVQSAADGALLQFRTP